MRILLTCHVRFASALAWYAYHLARGLRSAGHDVYLSSQRGSPLAEWARTAGIPGTDQFDYHSANPLHLAQAVRQLRRVVREYEPDVLNAHCPPGHALLAWVNSGRRPLIRTAAEPRSPRNNAVNRFIHERRTDGLIYSTATSAVRYAQVFSLTRVAQQVIYPGLDLSLFPETAFANWRQRLSVPDDALFAAVVARMSPEKGQEKLIEALALLEPGVRSRIVVLLTGDDNRQRTWRDLELLAQQKGVASSLRFASRLDDVRPLLSEIDLGVITSLRSEAVCRIALEYMAYGKPVITSDVNILPEVVRHDDTGWVFPSQEPARLAWLLERATTERAALRDMGERGRARLESEFTLAGMTERTIVYYQQVLARHGQ